MVMLLKVLVGYFGKELGVLARPSRKVNARHMQPEIIDELIVTE